MRNRKLFLIPLLFLVLSLLINVVYADNETDVDITEFPTQLSERWNISVLAGGVFLSTCTVFGFLLPLTLLKAKGLIILIVGLGVLGFCSAIGWLHYWVLLLISLLIAILYAGKVKRAL